MTERLSEIFLIRSTLNPDEFIWRGTPSENEQWEDNLKKFEEGEESVSVLPGSSSNTISFGIRLASDPSPEVWLNVDLPENYGQKDEGIENKVKVEQIEPALTLSGTSCPREELQSLQNVMDERLSDSEKEDLENRIFDVVSALQSHLADNPLAIPDSGSDGAEERGLAKENDQVLMARVIFWTHHLKAPSKRKDFAAWAPELDLWGITKLGYPGFLCWEGAAPDVDEIVKRIKGLQWAALSLRSDVRWIYSRKGTSVISNLEANSDQYKRLGKSLVSPSLFREALMNCPLSKGHPGMSTYMREDQKLNFKTSLEEVESMKELVERFRSMGIPEQEFVDAFSLRT